MTTTTFDASAASTATRHHTANPPASWGGVFAMTLCVFALIASYMPKAWEEIINIVLGVWLTVSPFVLGFSDATEVALHTVVVGILATAFAIWAMSNDQNFYKRWRSGHTV